MLQRVGVVAAVGVPVLELAAPRRVQLILGGVRRDAENEVVIG
jgi:hypothetical protein